MLIIFDFDGVLRTISWKGLYRSHCEICKYRGKNHKDFFGNFKEFKKWFNPDIAKNYERIGCAEGVVVDRNRQREIFHECYDSYISLFSWVPDILDKLSNKHDLTLLSSSPSASVKESLGDFKNFFIEIIGGEQVKKMKPDPEGVYLILNKFDCDAGDAVIIGDTEADIMAGRNAGIKTAAVVWGGIRDEQFLSLLNPDYIFRKPEDMLGL